MMVRMNFIKPNLTPCQMVEKRRKLLIVAMICFAFWQTGRIISEVANPSGHGGELWFVLDEAGDVCLGGFIAACIAIAFFIQRLHERPKLATMLNDELYNLNQLKAGFYAFFSCLATLGLIIAYAAFRPLSALIGANITLLVGFVIFIGSTIYLDRE